MRTLKRLVPLTLITLMIVALFPGVSQAQDACGQILQGTLAAQTQDFGPYDLPAGTTIRVVVIATVDNTDYLIDIGGDVSASAGNDLLAGDNRSISRTYEDPSTLTITLGNDAGEYNYTIGIICDTAPDDDNTEPGTTPPPDDFISRLFIGSNFSGIVADEGGISVWAYDEATDTGFEVFDIGVEVFAELREQYPDNPDENLLITTSDNGFYKVYMLSSGEFQINIGPVGEGDRTRIVEIILDDVPASNIVQREFYVYEFYEFD